MKIIEGFREGFKVMFGGSPSASLPTVIDQPTMETPVVETVVEQVSTIELGKREEPGARYQVGYWGVSFDGEKNVGEIGPIKDYYLDYKSIAMRSWQSMLESDVTRMVIGRFVMWVIGSGLRLQAEPKEKTLRAEKVELDIQEFSDSIEERYSIWANSTNCSWNGMMTMAQLEWESYKNACLGGDSLVVQRFDDKGQTIQIIDTIHLCNPIGSSWFDGTRRIVNGIELNERGEHVAYYIQKKYLEYERITAKNSLGFRTAFLVYGDRHRIDDHRGISRVVTVLETLAKTERYKEATVGSAEEVAKIAYQIVHQSFSTGENPLGDLAQAFDYNAPVNPATWDGEELANKVRATTNKQAINMPQGSEIKPMGQHKSTLMFKEFYMTLVECVCAVVGIPPNVALSKYDGNFSASRAALKDWEHTLEVERAAFSRQFHKHIYDFYLHVSVLTGKVEAPGYLTGFNAKNFYICESYRTARFVGDNVPHIDPEKEVRAERLKLGDAGGTMPLTTLEEATQRVGGGNSTANILQMAKELKKTKELGIVEEIPPSQSGASEEE